MLSERRDKMVIKCTLDTLSTAIQQVKQYEKQFVSKADLFLEMMAMKGAEIAKARVVDFKALDSYELLSSISYKVIVTGKQAIIISNSGHAAYVEFGTGLKGSEKRHPKQELWEYDVNKHGTAGWTYYNEKTNEFKHTTGYESRAFMYNTALELSNLAEQIAREVFTR